jgi:hypothetical protein
MAKEAKSMTRVRSDYLSYLLRLWQENGGEESQRGPARAVWRASLETPGGESHGFASLDDLIDFLRRQIGAAPDVEPGCSPPERRAEDADQI